MTNPAPPDGPADPRHLLVIGAGPGLGGAIARRFAQGGYRLTLLARHTDGLAKLASDLADTRAAVDTVAADASDPQGLRASLTSLYASTGAPGVLVYKVPRLSCTAMDRGITPQVLVAVNNFRSESSAYMFAICHRGRAFYFPALDINGNEVNYTTTSCRAGDVIKVSAKVTTSGTAVQVTDVTTRITKKRTGPGARPSAAFIGDDSVFLGAMRVGVPNFGTLTLTSCLVDGRALARSHPARNQRVNSRGILQIATGALSPGGTAFATHYRHF